MNILITNDDGFQAVGLQILYETLAASGRHAITVAAPERERSGCGRSLTLRRPLFAARRELRGGDAGYIISGMPVDCVKLAVQGNLLPPPDILLSGLNAGPNLGTDVFYSGTVGAALEGSLLGIPSLALSVLRAQTDNYMQAALYVRRLLDESLAALFGPAGAAGGPAPVYNFNFPDAPWRGLAVTRLSTAVYRNDFELRHSPAGGEYYWIKGELNTEDEPADTDWHAVRAGYISCTPISNDVTDEPAFAARREREEALSRALE
ncbi:MAG: 5'/3'-nucleotidase SurE [Gracilibacteraceae bacterium]|jgi:5'-nucleotidase|nr:5'/3'-nucleotidase SurE [Gracilibacteraceae bacterium]